MPSAVLRRNPNNGHTEHLVSFTSPSYTLSRSNEITGLRGFRCASTLPDHRARSVYATIYDARTHLKERGRPFWSLHPAPTTTERTFAARA